MSPMKHYLNFTEDLICIVDDNGLFLDVNSNWKGVFHISPGQGVSFFHLLHESHRPSVKSFFKDPLHSVVRLPECRFVDFSGKSHWLDLKIRRIEGQNRYWCHLKDLTLKKHFFSLLDQISENYNLGHWEYESLTGEVKWSLKIYDIFNKNPINYIPKLEDLEHFFDKQYVDQLMELINTKSEFDCVFPYVDKSNQHQWIKLSGKKESLNDGHFTLRGILQDVTKEMQKEKTLLLSNIELSSFEKGLEQFSIVARTDARGKIIYANDAFCKISRYSHSELIGSDHRILNSGYHPRSFFKEMWDCIHNGKNWRGVIKNRAKDGSHYWVDTIIIPIRDNDENLKEILSFRFDITALKNAELKNQILCNQLELIRSQNNSSLWSFDFSNGQMQWESETLSKLNLPANFKLSYEFLKGSLGTRNKTLFEECLKDSDKNDFSANIQINSNHFQLMIKIIRNHKGEPVRMDGSMSTGGLLKIA